MVETSQELVAEKRAALNKEAGEGSDGLKKRCPNSVTFTKMNRLPVDLVAQLCVG